MRQGESGVLPPTELYCAEEKKCAAQASPQAVRSQRAAVGSAEGVELVV